MLHSHLKERTAVAHQALEKQMVGLIRQIKTTDDYAEFLKLMYGFYHAVESRMEKFLAASENINFEKRRKSAWILNDIRMLSEPSEVGVCDRLPVINSYNTALGAMYVLEGSALGGKIIARMISAQTGLAGPAGLTFFQGYGEDTQRMWEDFKENLNTSFADEEADKIIETANDTFTTFKYWIERNAKN